MWFSFTKTLSWKQGCINVQSVWSSCFLTSSNAVCGSCLPIRIELICPNINDLNDAHWVCDSEDWVLIHFWWGWSKGVYIKNKRECERFDFTKLKAKDIDVFYPSPRNILMIYYHVVNNSSLLQATSKLEATYFDHTTCHMSFQALYLRTYLGSEKELWFVGKAKCV